MSAPPQAVTVRRLDRLDAGHAVDTVFTHLSPQSRYLRFHSPAPRLTAGVRAQLVDLDGRRRAAVVAAVPGPDGSVPIGIARLAGSGGGPADVAVAVVDAWQRRGVGTSLFTALAGVAEEIGYTELRGAVLPHNVAMQAMVRSAFPWARSAWDGEVVQLVVPIGPAAWTVTDEDLLADLLRR